MTKIFGKNLRRFVFECDQYSDTASSTYFNSSFSTEFQNKDTELNLLSKGSGKIICTDRISTTISELYNWHERFVSIQRTVLNFVYVKELVCPGCYVLKCVLVFFFSFDCVRVEMNVCIDPNGNASHFRILSIMEHME